jgi:hypothetical protein
MTPSSRGSDHEFAQDGQQYKVYRLLDPLLAAARKEQRSGYSVDVRIYARRKPNGDLWGEVAFLGRDGRIVTLGGDTAADAIPLAEPLHVEQYLSSIVARLFAAAEGRPPAGA